MLVGKWKARTMGAPTWLSVEGPVLALHVVGKGRGTIKQAAEKLGKDGQLHQMHPRTKGYATVGREWKATITGTLHDKMYQLRHGGVSGRQLRHKDNRQIRINEPRGGKWPILNLKSYISRKQRDIPQSFILWQIRHLGSQPKGARWMKKYWRKPVVSGISKGISRVIP